MTDKPMRPDGIPAGPGKVGAGDKSLRPDPAGHADPIGVPATAAGDLSLRLDPAGPGGPAAPSAHGEPVARATVAGPVGGRRRGRGRRAGDGPRGPPISRGRRASGVTGLAGDIQDRLSGVAEDARVRASAAYDDARTRVGTIHKRHMRTIDDLTVQGIDGINRGKGAVERFVDENPLLVGVVGVAAGLLLGALLPRTRQEDKNLGPWADEVRDQGLRYAREVTSIGREFVQTALDPDNLNAAARKVADTETPTPPPGERTAHKL